MGNHSEIRNERRANPNESHHGSRIYMNDAKTSIPLMLIYMNDETPAYSHFLFVPVCVSARFV